MRLRLFLVLFCSPFVFAQGGDPSQMNSGYIWRQATGGMVLGTPSAQPQSVVAVLDSGTVKAYSGSGELLWSFSARGGLCPYVRQSREGISFICTVNGSTFLLSKRNGRGIFYISKVICAALGHRGGIHEVYYEEEMGVIFGYPACLGRNSNDGLSESG